MQRPDGPPDSLSAILQAHFVEILKYCQRHLPDELRSSVEPADVVQDVLCEALRRAVTFKAEDETSWTRWLLTIARHRIIDLVRLKRSGQEKPQSLNAELAEQLLQEAAVYDRTPSKSAAAKESQHLVNEALGRLKPEYAQALRWRYFENRSHRDVAEETGRTEDAVRKFCAYALAAFKAEMVVMFSWQ